MSQIGKWQSEQANDPESKKQQMFRISSSQERNGAIVSVANLMKADEKY